MEQNETGTNDKINPERMTLEDWQRLLTQKEASIHAKGRLIDNMAYQIRTLSNAVIGFSDLLLCEELKEDLLEYVQEISQAGKGLSGLVNEVLDWARLETGRLKVAKVRCDLSEILKEIETVLISGTQQKDLDYEITTDPDLPAWIQTDADRLLKCLICIIANGLCYTEKGMIKVHIIREIRNDQPGIRFDVIDSGRGIRPEKLETIFEPSMHEEDAGAQVVTMLDLGLAVPAGLPLTKLLCEALDGSITVQSELNAGSTFSVWIPFGCDVDDSARLEYKAAAQNSQLEACEPDTDPAEMVLKPVLLVEDQPSNRTVISLMLESLGVEVETAEDGAEGVEKAVQGDYSLILMDLKMPKMDGYQATDEIRERNIKTPIVALSAKVLDECEHHQISMIFDAFLTKPVDSRKLSETLEQFVPALGGTTHKKGSTVRSREDTNDTLTFEYGSTSGEGNV